MNYYFMDFFIFNLHKDNIAIVENLKFGPHLILTIIMLFKASSSFWGAAHNGLVFLYKLLVSLLFILFLKQSYILRKLKHLF